MSIARKILMGSSGGKKSTYVDDVFSTYVYKGNDANRTITNNIDLAGEGGLVWAKGRNLGYYNILQDNVSGLTGTTNYLTSNENHIANASSNQITAFNNNGFDLGIGAPVNFNTYDFTSWTFRKAPGFFDIVSWTGNGSNRTIAHNLGSVPGCIMVKRTDAQSNWMVYHRDAGGSNPGGWSYLFLDTTASVANATSVWNDTDPTSSVFSVGTDAYVNANGGSYVAYIFAGGESTAATARSVQLDGSGDYFTTSTSSDYTFGTGDFTVEHWVNLTGSASGQPTIIDARTTGSYTTQWVTYFDTDYTYNFYAVGGNRLKSSRLAINTWNHIAVVRSSGVTTLYVNGISQGTYADTNNYSMTSIVFGANAVNFGHNTNGRLSNLRVVKGTAVYTSSFKPPTQPLTNITNTKLLCFNNSSTTGTTVGTITASGNPTASTKSPFDDPEGFQFGEEGDQNLIKCGSYKTDPNEDAFVNLGWEPQWVIIKRTDGAHGWNMVDSMRGFPNAQNIEDNASGQCKVLEANSAAAETTTSRYGLTSTGFYADQYGANRTYVYIAIRRPDGLVGKPAEAGTDVFNQAYGNYASGNNPIPNFTAGFPVDFAWAKSYAGSGDWWTSARLLQAREVQVNTNIAAQSGTNKVFDSNVGWHNNNGYDWYISHMWKRHAGFDVQTYTGRSVNGARSHSMGIAPEMMWVKRRDATSNWAVYHKDLHQYPQDYYLILNDSLAAVNASQWWKPPTNTHWFTAIGGLNNVNGASYIAMLFASVDGISKVGSYTGTGSSGNSVSLGFQPRFLIVKNASWSHGDWFVYDTTRGWVSGNDSTLKLNSTAAQLTNSTWDIDPTSTGFTVQSTDAAVNQNGHNFIYYAHA